MKLYGLLGLMLMGAGVAQETRGQGLRMNYSRIAVDNLPIGQTVSMRQLANFPLKLRNNYDIPIEITIAIRPPSVLHAGYEAIPNTNWIRPDFDAVEASPGEDREVDISISVPNDEALLGRRFQADVHVLTVGDRGARGVRTGYEITGSLLFSIAPKRNEDALRAALDHPANGAFTLDPPRVDIFDAQPGNTIPIRTSKGLPVRLVNDSDQEQRYELEAVDTARSAYHPDSGSQPMPPDDIRVAAPVYSLDAGRAVDLDVSVRIPEDTDMEKGPLLYLLAVRNGALKGVEQYVKIYLWPGAEPAATFPR